MAALRIDPQPATPDPAPANPTSDSANDDAASQPRPNSRHPSPAIRYPHVMTASTCQPSDPRTTVFSRHTLPNRRKMFSPGGKMATQPSACPLDHRPRARTNRTLKIECYDSVANPTDPAPAEPKTAPANNDAASHAKAAPSSAGRARRWPQSSANRPRHPSAAD